jgi:lyso-ornithine lipid O-acyltransferase
MSGNGGVTRLTDDVGSPLRALGRLVIYLSFTFALMPVQVFALRFSRGLAISLPIFYHRCCCWIMGLHVVAHGEVSTARPTLFISNHSSYIDITVLASQIPASFVAKAEVAEWPLFGILAKLQRTVFVERRVSRAAYHRDEMRLRLAQGENLILFPEGTSSDGNRVLPFKSALFSVAQEDIDGQELVVQPVSIAYTRLDGMPVGRTLKPHFAWYGDMDMAPHMWTLFGLGICTVEVMFHAPVTLSQFGSRKGLADHCYEVVSGGVSSANAGRRPEPDPIVASAPASAPATTAES